MFNPFAARMLQSASLVSSLETRLVSLGLVPDIPDDFVNDVIARGVAY